LEQLRARGELSPNLHLLDYQPAADVPAMLASADIGVVQLNMEANGMSIPSKVYSYAAAGLPILAAIPPENHAARLIRENGLGLVVAPGDNDGLLAAAHRLLSDPELRAACGAAGLAFTARHGDMDRIGRQFMDFLGQVLLTASRPAQKT
ncbi:MAG: glycosyltransferase, partial [Niveispirillum sp.]|nr:glycosyltransferase [Niveispirillum sp.]